jgi:hypothetical protein
MSCLSLWQWRRRYRALLSRRRPWDPHAEVEAQTREPQGMDRVEVLRRAVGDDAV